MPERRQTTKKASVSSVVSTLREEILARNEDGWRIGFEDDVQLRMGVSRPTLRQALRMLESEGLLEVRRGVNGGLFARIPGQDSLARNTSAFIRAHGVSASELMVAQSAIFAGIVRVAIENPQRTKLKEWMQQRDAEGEYTPRRALQTSLEFMRVASTMSGNPILGLFEETLYELARGPFYLGIFDDPNKAALALQHLRDLADAVAESDFMHALALIELNTSVVLGWIAESEHSSRTTNKTKVTVGAS